MFFKFTIFIAGIPGEANSPTFRNTLSIFPEIGAFIFAFNYWLGKTILGISSPFEMPKTINMQFVNTILEAGFDVYLSLMVGGVITGSLFAITSYHILKQFIEKRQHKL